MTAQKTVGESSIELSKKLDQRIVPKEIEESFHKGDNSKKSYEEEVWETVSLGKKDPKIIGDFYVVVLLKKERLMKNVVRNLFHYRGSCPTPQFDQTVYKYHLKPDRVEYLWTIPDTQTCQLLSAIETDLPDDQQPLIYMVKAFNTGALDTYAATLNNEILF